MMAIGEEIIRLFRCRPRRDLPCRSASDEEIDAAVKSVESAGTELRHTVRNQTMIAANAALKLLKASQQ